MAISTNVPKGFSDNDPNDAFRVERTLDVFRESFRTFGFLPLDTPAVEYREALTGSETGIAGDNQIFTVANVDYSRAKPVTGPDGPGYPVKPELGLRFDLTVPLARYVAGNHGRLSFPFRRYQLDKVWRGEKPQEGRYREFVQCDIDTISNAELTPYEDAEALACANDALERLGVPGFSFKVNNRRAVQELLTAAVGDGIDSAAVLRVLDKREKVGDTKVLTLLEAEAGLAAAAAKDLLKRLDAGYEKGLSPEFDAAVDELNEYVDTAVALGVPRERITVDPSLARGLGYYTGNVVETFVTGAEAFGSICSGGRYDDLTKNFGSKPFPGTGVSIGLSRLQAALDSLEPDRGAGRYLDLFVGVLSPELRNEVYPILDQLRSDGISVVCNPSENRLKQLLKQADRSACRFALFFGENEAAARSVSLKDLETGEETDLALDQLRDALIRLRAA